MMNMFMARKKREKMAFWQTEKRLLVKLIREAHSLYNYTIASYQSALAVMNLFS